MANNLLLKNGEVLWNGSEIKVYNSASPPAYNYTPTIYTEGYYPLVADFTDQSGNNKDMTPTANVELINDGKFTKAYKFTGLNNSYAVTSVAVLPAVTNFTMSAWLRWETAVGVDNNLMAICSGSNDNGVAFGKQGPDFSNYIIGLIAQKAWILPNNTSAPAGWFNVILTRDTSTIRLYFNGNEFGWHETEPLLGTAASIGGMVGSTYFWCGDICEVIFESVCWSATDVSNYYTPRA